MSALVRFAEPDGHKLLALSGWSGVWVDTPKEKAEEYQMIWLRDQRAPVTELAHAQSLATAVQGHAGLITKEDKRTKDTNYALRVRAAELQACKARLAVDPSELYLVTGLPVHVTSQALQDALKQWGWEAEILPSSRRQRKTWASFLARSNKEPSVGSFPLQYGETIFTAKVEKKRRGKVEKKDTKKQEDDWVPDSWEHLLSGRPPAVRSSSKKPTQQGFAGWASSSSVASSASSKRMRTGDGESRATSEAEEQIASLQEKVASLQAKLDEAMKTLEAQGNAESRPDAHMRTEP